MAQSHLAHQFEDEGQQYQASLLGMWTFLITEILFFGGLFTGYAVYRWIYPDAFEHASNHLNFVLGTINTLILITSSFTMALAVHASGLGKRKMLVNYLCLTIFLGLVFLSIKGYEYLHKFHEHLVPGAHFLFSDYTGPGIELFYSFYFAMTGLHALHMIIGVVILAILGVRAHHGAFTADYHTPVELMGLYWHFVDIIWIFLYPLLYLAGRHL